MTPIVRLCLAAFGMDMALYLTLTGVPFRALALGADPLTLGFLPAAYSLPYTLTVLWAGGHIDRGERLRVARRSLLVGAAAVAGLSFADRMLLVFLGPAILGVALAFFWPAMQASFADLAAAGRSSAGVVRTLGWFNISWSLGKGTGFAAGGWLLAEFGFDAVFLTAAAVVLGVSLLVRSVPAAPPPAPPPSRPGVPARDPHARFRVAAWLGNATAFGAVAILNYHYPKWLATLGRDERLFGAYLGLIFFSQTATFIALSRWDGWRFRPAWLLAVPAPLLVVLAVLPRLTDPAAILATAPAIGFSVGSGYFASLFYSVGGPAGRGRFAGIHEALLGLGSTSLPVLGGGLARAAGRLDAPYLLAAGFGAAAVAVQSVLLRSRPAARGTGTGGSGWGYYG